MPRWWKYGWSKTLSLGATPVGKDADIRASDMGPWNTNEVEPDPNVSLYCYTSGIRGRNVELHRNLQLCACKCNWERCLVLGGNSTWVLPLRTRSLHHFLCWMSSLLCGVLFVADHSPWLASWVWICFLLMMICGVLELSLSLFILSYFRAFVFICCSFFSLLLVRSFFRLFHPPLSVPFSSCLCFHAPCLPLCLMSVSVSFMLFDLVFVRYPCLKLCGKVVVGGLCRNRC